MEAKRRRGESLDDHLPDAFLAAAAARRRLSVVTRNAREFRNIGVETANPWTARRRRLDETRAARNPVLRWRPEAEEDGAA